MAAANGNAAHSLIDVLREPHGETDVLGVAVLLRRMAGGQQVVDPDEAVRFEGDFGLDYPMVEGELTDRKRGEHFRVRLHAFGAAGIMGPLPHAWAELLESRRRLGDEAMIAFLEIFEHRLASLFLQAHLAGRFWLGYSWRIPAEVPPERRGDTTGEPLEAALLALAGLSRPEVQDSLLVPPLSLLPFAAMLARRPRSMSAVEAMVSELLGVEAHLIPFEGDWVPIPESERLGVGQARLGETAVLGDRYFDPGLGFRIALGPLSLARLRQLEPEASDAQVMGRVVPFLVGETQPYLYDLHLHPEECPPARLTSEADAPQRLGRTLWLYSDDEGPARRPPVCGPLVPPTKAGRMAAAVSRS